MLIVLEGSSRINLVALFALNLYLLACVLQMLLHVDPHQIVSTFRTTELLLWAAVLNVVLERIN